MECQNCQTEASGNFCHNCGQSLKARRAPFLNLMHGFTDEVFAWDSKLFVGLLQLFAFPGRLTKRFLDGERVSILHPIRMYLVMSLMFFIVFEIPISAEYMEGKNLKIQNVFIGKVNEEATDSDVNIIHMGEDNFLADWFSEQMIDVQERMKDVDPRFIVSEMFVSLNQSLSKFLILYLPIFALLLKLSFLFTRNLYYDHVLFSLHFQSFLMGWVVLIYALSVWHTPVWAVLSLYVPYYLAKAMKVVYQQSYWWIVPKTALVLGLFVVTLMFMSIIVMLFTVLTLGQG